MALLEVPAPRPNEQNGRVVAEHVPLFSRIERDRSLERVGEVALAVDAVEPRGRVRILEVGHEDAGPRVQGIDHHLAIDRPRDLDPPVGDLGWRRLDAPVGGADLGGLGQEIRQLACLESFEPGGTPGQQLDSPRAELALKVLEECGCVGCEDVGGLDHPPIISFRRTASSVVAT